MTYLNILSLLLLLVLASRAELFQNESLKRSRRLSHGSYNEETIRLARFMVSIRTRTAHKYYGDNHFCGGVILSPQFVLTSSHCVTNSHNRAQYPTRILVVVAGTPNRLRLQRGRTFHSPVKDIMVPDNFTILNEMDFAVLLLKVPLPRDRDYIAIAQLPMRPIKVGTTGQVMGWGRMFASGPMSAKILHSSIQIINSKVCAELLNIKKNDLLCGRNRDSKLDPNTCVGDHGSPLIHKNTVYGIVSYIVGCDSNQLPSVYTDVFRHVRWIRRAIMFNGASVSHVSVFLVYGAVFVNFIFGIFKYVLNIREGNSNNSIIYLKS